MSNATGSAFVTSRKGFCYLTIKIGRENFDLMKIRQYTLDAQDKRDMRRLHLEIEPGHLVLANPNADISELQAS